MSAIRERRLLSVIYGDAVEPQTFAPYVLYFGAARQVLLGGCEITRRRVKWRQFEVATARHLADTADRFTPGGVYSPKAEHHPRTVISMIEVDR